MNILFIPTPRIRLSLDMLWLSGLTSYVDEIFSSTRLFLQQFLFGAIFLINVAFFLVIKLSIIDEQSEIETV